MYRVVGSGFFLTDSFFSLWRDLSDAGQGRVQGGGGHAVGGRVADPGLEGGEGGVVGRVDHRRMGHSDGQLLAAAAPARSTMLLLQIKLVFYHVQKGWPGYHQSWNPDCK